MTLKPHHPAPMRWHVPLASKLLTQGLPQSLMVIGRSGDGLEQLCLHLAEMELTHLDPQGKQMMESKTHPDLHLLCRETNTTGKLRQHIVVDQVRTLISAAHLTPLRGEFRYGVIVPACRLNKSAANALLKLLEEPPSSVKLILGVEHLDWLPATVRSRCRMVHAPNPTQKEALEWLAHNSSLQDPAKVLAIAAGAPLHASDCEARIPALELLAEFCLGKQPLTGPQPKLDQLQPQIWIPWTVCWSVDGTRLASGLQPLYPNLANVAEAMNTKRKLAPLTWLNLYGSLMEVLSFAVHPVTNRSLLEYVTWLFHRLALR